MTIDLYSFKLSRYCRAVQMTARELGIQLNVKNINTGKGEQFAPEFLKINPIHSIPTIVDDGFALWESRAILRYLCNKYAPDSTLYPKEPQKRAIVDRWLDFDMSLDKSLKQALMSKKYLDTAPSEEQVKVFESNLKIVNDLLGDNKYLTGNHLTIADLSVLAQLHDISTAGYDLKDMPNMKRWITTLKSELPYYEEINEEDPQLEKEWADNSKDYIKRLINK